MHRVAACLLTALLPSLLLLSGTAVASTDIDTQAPVLVSADASPTNVDVGKSAQDVTISTRVTDQGSGTTSVLAGLTSTTSAQQKLAFLTLTTGDRNDGTWTGTITLPQNAATGEWRVYVNNLDDAVGNRTYNSPVPPETPTVTVTSSTTSDTQAPVLVSADASPTNVDVGKSAQDVTISTRVTDQGSGTTSVLAGLTSTTSAQQKLAFLTLTTGDRNDGTWTGTITLPQNAATGEWRVYVNNLDDAVGNRTYNSPVPPETPTVTVTSSTTSDTQAPVLVSADASPTNVDVGKSAQDVTISTRVTDQGSGTTSVLAGLTSTTSAQQKLAFLTLTTGDRNDGTWTGTITLPQNAATGEWRVYVNNLDDAVGNRTYNSPVPPETPTVTVTSTKTGPSTPERVSATAGDTASTVSWTPPADDGGLPISGYTVITSPGGARTSVPGDQTSLDLTGLTNGTGYTFRVIATNALGSSPASAPSATVRPAGLPGAPQSVTAEAGNARATVSWAAPASTNGSAITGYTITSSPGGVTRTVTGGARSATLTGLSAGTGYTFRVVATNGVGSSPASAPSNRVVPLAVPTAPLDPAATAGNTRATITWTRPASAGGSPITGYTVTSYPGGLTRTVAASARTATVTGLTNGTYYAFRVVATNAVGTSPASAPTLRVRPQGAPAAPVGASATTGDATATITWATPPSNGGSPITGYTVTSYPGGLTRTVAASARTATLTGLSNGTGYTFRVTATNALGTSPASAPTTRVVPTGRPTTPLNPAATAGDARATITWAAPASNGGSPITGYTITSTPGGHTRTVGPGARTVTLTGLTNGTGYTFQITATNALGTSPATDPTPPITPTPVQQ